MTTQNDAKTKTDRIKMRSLELCHFKMFITLQLLFLITVRAVDAILKSELLHVCQLWLNELPSVAVVPLAAIYSDYFVSIPYHRVVLITSCHLDSYA